MKKFFKALLSFLVLIPCALSLVACGSDLKTDAKVNTKGDYQEAKAEDVTTFLGETAEADAFKKGVKSTIVMALGTEAEMKINSIFTYDDKGAVTGFALLMDGANKEEKATAECYYKEGVLYVKSEINDKSYTYKQEVKAEDAKDYDYSDIDYSALIASLKASLVASAYMPAPTVTKATSGKTTKWKMVVNVELMQMSGEAYYVFNENSLVGMISNMTMGTGEEAMTLNVTAVAFDGKISYPKNLDKYSGVAPEKSIFDMMDVAV